MSHCYGDKITLLVVWINITDHMYGHCLAKLLVYPSSGQVTGRIVLKAVLCKSIIDIQPGLVKFIPI